MTKPACDTLGHMPFGHSAPYIRIRCSVYTSKMWGHMAVTMTPIRLDTHLADGAAVKSRTKVVHVALGDCRAEAVPRLDEKERGKALVRRSW